MTDQYINPDLSWIRNARFWTNGVPIEWEAINQVDRVSRLPIVPCPVAIMPDVHYGVGAVVGSVIPTKDAIIPSAVGVDIGCGMAAFKTGLSKEIIVPAIDLIRTQLEAAIPTGFSAHSKFPKLARTHPMYAKYAGQVDAMKSHNDDFDALAISKMLWDGFDGKKIDCQTGTLGGGNHFIEICLDTNDDVWVMLHSGSRNVGKCIGETGIAMAAEQCNRTTSSSKTPTWLGWWRELMSLKRT